MSHVFHRHTQLHPPIAVRGEGVFIVDESGHRYLDASGGAAVSCLGHSHPRVVAAIKQQVDEIAFAHTSFFSSQAAEELADVLIATAPIEMGRVYFVSGGSEGMEAALKMARQYFLEIGQPKRHHFIARWQSYHGNTLGALSVGGNRWRREPFQPLLTETTHVSPCFAYRYKEPGESDAEYARRLGEELEATILRLGPETVAAFIAETVVGATSGAVPPVADYFHRVREICDRYGVLLILDEVMCGMGRTGSLHACEQEAISPDLLVIAKGLGAGYQPIGAVLVREAIYEAFVDGSGFFQHGHTYLGHPTACAAALAVQDAIREEHLLPHVREMGLKLMRALTQRFGDNPQIGDIRGRGLFLGLELVADRATKRPFDPSLRLHRRIKEEAFHRGLLVYPMGGTIDGRVGDHVLVAPPFIIDDGHIEIIVDRLGQAVDMALSHVHEPA